MEQHFQSFIKYLQWMALVLLISSGNFVFGTNELSTFPHVIPSNNTRCGKVFSGNTGGIFYKPFVQVVENERCMWQISVPGAKGYSIKFHHFEYNVPLKVKGIVISSYSRHGVLFQYQPNTTTSIKIFGFNLLIVTFYTGLFETTTETTGFALEYETIFEGKNPPKVAKESKHYNIGSKRYFIKHPSGFDGDKLYQKHELSTFVFLPRNNVVKNGRKNTVIYNKIGIINYYCWDRLKIYFFNINLDKSTAGWIFQGTICANTDVEAISSFEPILIVFESDDNFSKSYGFHLSYVAG